MLTWFRERVVRLASTEPDPPGVTVPAWLVRAAKCASWVAMAVLVYFLWLYTLDIARDRAGALQLSRVGTWTSDTPLSVWFPYVVGFGVLAFGIPYVAKIAIPTFMSLDWRSQAWPKAWALLIALAVSVVIITGTFSVQGETLMERDRDSAVAVATVHESRQRLLNRVQDIDARLAQMRDRTRNNEYAATAANVGAVAYRRSYMSEEALARSPAARRDIIVRALGAAEAADALEAERRELRDQIAAAPVEASVARRVETERTSWIGATLDWVQGVRAILLALVMDVVCLMMPWIALRLEQTRNLQMGLTNTSERPIDPARTLSDLRDEPGYAFRRARDASELGSQEIMIDAETGDRITEVRPHRRRIKKQGKTRKLAEVMFDAKTALADEVGKQMPSDERVASRPEQQSDEQQSHPDQAAHGEREKNEEQAQLSDSDLEALIEAGELADESTPESPAVATPSAADDSQPPKRSVALPDGEGVMQHHMEDA